MSDNRIGKLIRLLASDQPGEVVNAAAALTKALKTQGRDWHDVAAALSPPSNTVTSRRSGEVDRDEVRIVPMSIASSEMLDVIACLRMGHLSNNADSFLWGLEVKARLYSRVALTHRQADWLADLRAQWG